ncbi:PepSY domain-containing protein [Candidatus Poribacteria bacterium]|nr:PepSY domain-containing protein [Candidatus Poribacteria bacterium]
MRWFSILTITALILGMVVLAAFADNDENGKPEAGKPAKIKQEKPVVTPKITDLQAVVVVTNSLPFSAGDGKQKLDKDGNVNKLEILLLLPDGTPVAKVKLAPASGKILTKGEKATATQKAISIEDAVKIVKEALLQFGIGVAELSKHGDKYKVAITMNGNKIADVKVDSQTGQIIPKKEGEAKAAVAAPPPAEIIISFNEPASSTSRLLTTWGSMKTK